MTDLRTEYKIDITWMVADVLAIRPDLDEEQALDVLQTAKMNHDANIGINWDVLESIATDLYGDPNEKTYS